MAEEEIVAEYSVGWKSKNRKHHVMVKLGTPKANAFDFNKLPSSLVEDFVPRYTT
jgi:hypothetical protein